MWAQLKSVKWGLRSTEWNFDTILCSKFKKEWLQRWKSLFIEEIPFPLGEFIKGDTIWSPISHPTYKKKPPSTLSSSEPRPREKVVVKPCYKRQLRISLKRSVRLPLTLKNVIEVKEKNSLDWIFPNFSSDISSLLEAKESVTSQIEQSSETCHSLEDKERNLLIELEDNMVKKSVVKFNSFVYREIPHFTHYSYSTLAILFYIKKPLSGMRMLKRTSMHISWETQWHEI